MSSTQPLDAQPLRREQGTTLIELLVGLLFAGWFAVMLHQFSRSMLYGISTLEAASEVEESVRVALHIVTRDLRDAGFSLDGRLGNGISAARGDGVTVVADRNGDGDTDDPNERISYSIDAASHTLRRGTGLAPPQPFLPNLTAEGAAFHYYDAAGDLLIIDGGDDPARAKIQRVEITLQVELPNPDPRSRKPLRVAQTAAVALRNG